MRKTDLSFKLILIKISNGIDKIFENDEGYIYFGFSSSSKTMVSKLRSHPFSATTPVP